MTRIRITLVAGARPNFMKIAPLIRELRKHEDVFDWRLVHTGQHYDHGMSDVFFQELGIPEPQFHMGAGGGSHAEQTARVMIAFEKYCVENPTDWVLVVGDVDSTLACAVTAKKLKLKVIHVEAGLRSGDITMPEEINRIVTDSISDLFFVTEPSGLENLKAEGHAENRVHFVGHVMIDNLLFQLEQLKTIDAMSYPTHDLKQRLGNYGVVTLHRPSNVDSADSLSNIVEALGEVSRRLPLIFAIHPRTAANLKKFGIRLAPTIHVTTPLPYMEFLNLWKDARIILTDSGGIQEESTALGIPCITLRESTERPVTVTEGTNILVGTDRKKIIEGAMRCIEGAGEFVARRPRLWDGRAAERIVSVLLNHV